MEVVGRGHFVEATADGGVNDGDTKHTKPGGYPKRDKADSDMGTDDIDDPVWRQRGNAKDDEERNDVVLLRGKFAGPFVETGFPFRDGEQCGTEGSTDEVAEGGTRRNAGACQGEGTWDSPDSPTEDGKVHGTWQRKSLQTGDA